MISEKSQILFDVAYRADERQIFCAALVCVTHSVENIDDGYKPQRNKDYHVENVKNDTNDRNFGKQPAYPLAYQPDNKAQNFHSKRYGALISPVFPVL